VGLLVDVGVEDGVGVGVALEVELGIVVELAVELAVWVGLEGDEGLLAPGQPSKVERDKNRMVVRR